MLAVHHFDWTLHHAAHQVSAEFPALDFLPSCLDILSVMGLNRAAKKEEDQGTYMSMKVCV